MVAFLQGRFSRKLYLQVDDGPIPRVWSGTWAMWSLIWQTNRGGVITVHLVGDGGGCDPSDHSVMITVDSQVEVTRRFVYGGPGRHVPDPGVTHHCHFVLMGSVEVFPLMLISPPCDLCVFRQV